jgi:hypothetical protein
MVRAANCTTGGSNIHPFQDEPAATTNEAAGNTPTRGARIRDGIAVGVIAGFATSPSLLGPINTFDAGLAGASGTFILHGQLPYRDFWWLYGPLAPAIATAFTAMFGPTMLLLRLLGLALLMAQAGLGYAILRTRVDHLPAAMIAIASVSSGVLLLGLEISAWSLSLTLAMATITARSILPSRPGLAGVLAGLTFVTRFDVGGYVLLACLALGNRRSLIAGFALVAVPVLGALVLTTPLGALYEQVVWFPLFGQRQFRAVPAPPVVDAIVLLLYVPIVAVPKIAIAAAAVRLLLLKIRPPAFVVLTLFATFCQLQTQGRADISHQAQAAGPGFLLIGLWMMDVRLLPAGAERVAAKVRAQRLAALGVVGLACAFAYVAGALTIFRIDSRPLGSGDAAFVAGVRTLAANTNREEPVFVGLTSHRYTTVNAMLAYYLADRRSGVRVSIFNPGVTNTEPVQREMVQNLIDTNTQVLLLDAKPALLSEQTNDSRIAGAEVLDDYISATFTAVCLFGDTRVFATPQRAPSIKCVEPRQDRLVDILSGLGSGG